MLRLYWALQNLKTDLNTGNPQLWGPCPVGCLPSLSCSRLDTGDTRKCKGSSAALPSTWPFQATVFLNPQTFDMRKFISLTSAKGESDPILQCIAKNSLALSSNPVQLPKGYCRLAQHIKFGLPTSRRQRTVTHQMLSTLTPISVGLAWKLNNVRGGTKIKLLYWSFEFHIWQDFKERTVTWGHFNGISQCNCH